MPQREISSAPATASARASLHIPAGSGPWPGRAHVSGRGKPARRLPRHGGADGRAGLRDPGARHLLPLGEYAPFRDRVALQRSGRARALGEAGQPAHRGMRSAWMRRPSSAICPALDEVTGSAVGTTGYCMGGVALAARRRPASGPASPRPRPSTAETLRRKAIPTARICCADRSRPRCTSPPPRTTRRSQTTSTQRLEQALTDAGRDVHDGDLSGRPRVRRHRQPDLRRRSRAAALGRARRAVREAAALGGSGAPGSGLHDVLQPPGGRVVGDVRDVRVVVPAADLPVA